MRRRSSECAQQAPREKPALHELVRARREAADVRPRVIAVHVTPPDRKVCHGRAESAEGTVRNAVGPLVGRTENSSSAGRALREPAREVPLRAAQANKRGLAKQRQQYSKRAPSAHRALASLEVQHRSRTPGAELEQLMAAHGSASGARCTIR